MNELNDNDYEFILELIDEAYANQQYLIEDIGRDHIEYDDHIRLDEIRKVYDKLNKSLIKE